MKNFTVATEAVALESVRAPPPLEASLNNGLEKACELKLLQWAIPWLGLSRLRAVFVERRVVQISRFFFGQFFIFSYFQILFQNIGMRSLPNILHSVKFPKFGNVTCVTCFSCSNLGKSCSIRTAPVYY